MSEPYANIRELLGCFIGKTIIDVTQHDQEEWEASRDSYTMLMFNDGSYIQFPISDEGFSYKCECPEGAHKEQE